MKCSRRLSVGLALGIVSTTVAVMAFAQHNSRPPLSFEWDFSQRHDVSMVPWPADNHADTYWWGQRKIRVKIRIDADRRYANEEAWDVYAERDGERLRAIQVMEQPTTADEASRRVEELLKAWGAEPKGLKSWLEGAVGDSVVSYLKNVRTTDRARWPEISVEILRSPASPDRPWYVHIELYWFNEHPTTQAAGR